MVGNSRDNRSADRIELRTLVPMTFRIDGQAVEIPAGERCFKPAYDDEIERRLAMMAKRQDARPGVRAVCVVLRGEHRYIYRDEVEVVVR